MQITTTNLIGNAPKIKFKIKFATIKIICEFCKQKKSN